MSSWVERARWPADVGAARRMLTAPLRRWLGARAPEAANSQARGRVRFGDLRRLTPISRHWGYDRGGGPVDRYYIERFLAAHALDVRGTVLEIGDDVYTRKFGGDRVECSDVLHVVDGNPRATIVGDLTRADHIPAASFDCIILTQVLQFVRDPAAAVRTINRILKTGGVVLATGAGIAQISRKDMEQWGEYWRFTDLSARTLFAEVFPAANVEVETCGNVLAAVAFLHGLAASELSESELEFCDPYFQVLVTVRAVKSDE